MEKQGDEIRALRAELQDVRNQGEALQEGETTLYQDQETLWGVVDRQRERVEAMDRNWEEVTFQDFSLEEKY